MHDQITHGLNLIDSHIFQFDFLNDPFSKLPQSLRDVIEDEEKRRKLVIFINPPYAEGDNRNGIGRAGVAANTQVAQKYAQEMAMAKENYSCNLLRVSTMNSLQWCLQNFQL